MPRYEYKCPRGHVTDRIVPLSKAPGPKTVLCEGPCVECSNENGHRCRLRAKRREVYVVGVGGDLPTRGAF